jgi:hypothetical protein
MIKKTVVLSALLFLIVSCAPPLRVSYFPGARPHLAFAVLRYDPPAGMGRGDVDWRLRERGAAIGADALVVEVDTVYRERVWVGPYRPYRGRNVRRTVVRDHIIEAIAIRYQ